MKWMLFLFISNLMNKLNDINVKYRLYPRWIKRKNGSLLECVEDKDCPFPTACCNHPFYPLQYCCNGWNQRKLEYAYVYNTISSNKE